jgi:hypothetical protein
LQGHHPTIVPTSRPFGPTTGTGAPPSRVAEEAAASQSTEIGGPLHTSLHTIALKRVSYPALGIVHISAFIIIVGLFVISLLTWPIGALLRRRRGRSGATGWARGALILEIGVALTLTLGTAALFLSLGSTAIAYGATPILYLAAGLITMFSACRSPTRASRCSQE